MHDDNYWAGDKSRTIVWRLVEEAGEHGISRSTLVERSGLNAKTVEAQITALSAQGYIQRPPFTDRVLWIAGPKVPPIKGQLLDDALSELNDCPAGMSVTMLCQVLRCSPTQLDRELVPAENDGRIERVAMPATHGGGMGWRLAGPQVRALPVVEVDIDRIHRVNRPDVFAAHLSDGCLSITTGALTLTLSQAHTGKLRAFLRSEASL